VKAVTPANELWNQLSRIRFIRYHAVSQSETGWSGIGDGSVHVESPAPDIVLFSEPGTFTPSRGKPTRFTNVFRWTRLSATGLRLEHLRFGAENPVYLFDLEFQSDRTWRPNNAHICSEDCYSALLRLHNSGVDVRWSITGPKKDESILCEYRL
jgi:hypothetical protein